MSIHTIGVVGLGLCGRSAAACMLSRGLNVIACDTNPDKRAEAREHIQREIDELIELAQFPAELASEWPQRYHEADAIGEMADVDYALEAIPESVEGKRGVIAELEAVVAADAPIASNTSAIPITILQARAKHPQRIIGNHFTEPVHNTRLMEIIRGDKTDDDTLNKAVALGRRLDKDPSILKRDVRGFLCNRLMYALMREALYLLENDYADVESIDRSFRNDIGWYALIAGPFRMMDITGLQAYVTVMKDLFPDLAATQELPDTMKRIEAEGANGVFNGKGFYDYTPEEAEKWQRIWSDYAWDARRLADKYTPLDDDGEA